MLKLRVIQKMMIDEAMVYNRSLSEGLQHVMKLGATTDDEARDYNR